MNKHRIDPVYEAREAAWRAQHVEVATAAPIDMVLHCPACGLQHIDAPDDREPPMMYAIDGCASRSAPPWTNPPHRSHRCAGCGHTWRPADVCTNGVAPVTTGGKNDSPIAVPAGRSR